jgi:hypothetical protein
VFNATYITSKHKFKIIVGAKRSTQGKAQPCRKVTDKQTFFSHYVVPKYTLLVEIINL